MYDEYYGGASINASQNRSDAPAQHLPPQPPQDASTTIEAEAPTPSTSISSTSTPATPVIEIVLPRVDEQTQTTPIQEEQQQNDAVLEEEPFENPFATESAESSSRLQEPSNTHSLNPRYPSTLQ